MAELDCKQERFCFELATGNSKTKKAAAIAAGYSQKTAGEQASRLLRNVKVKARIKEIQRETLEETGFDAKEVKKNIIRRLMNIVMTDPSDFLHVSSPDDPEREAVIKELAELCGGQRILDFGELIMCPTEALTPEQAAAIKSIRINKVLGKFGDVILPDIEMHDPIAAARLIADITGIKQPDVQVNVNLAERLERSRARALKDG